MLQTRKKLNLKKKFFSNMLQTRILYFKFSTRSSGYPGEFQRPKCLVVTNTFFVRHLAHLLMCVCVATKFYL